MLEHDNQAVMDNDTYGHGHAVHHGSGLYREIHKDAADKGEIGVPEIQIIIMEKLRCLLRVTSTSLFLHPPHSLKGLLNQMEELVTLISKIPAEVVKALKNEANKQSQHEDYDKGSLNDMEVSRDEESNKPHILKEQQLLVVNAADKEASHEDDFENEDCSNLQALEDVNLTAKEDANEVNLKNQKSTDVIDVQERLIHVYGSLTSKRKKEPPIEIQKLAVMLPTYLLDNGFYDKTERTDWPSFEAYKGKITQQIGLINEIPFDVDYVQNIPQQASDSLNCGIFVCAYAEILSEGLQVHSCGFDAASQRAHYASLLWHYRVEKAPGATRSYHTVSLEIDNWKIERWSDTVPSRCPFLRDLELWCNAGEIALRYWKKDNSKFECWHDAS
ncbi:hypothetical protein T459_25397 [Capsicum annuum]|uniref:Ubiquitin-like protease family profile domain-containing protein n=1 Tax=Capsicum annuum TaxID=4072 RepID=A0A2G2YKM6_CAPAN|nr:hypothetical protein T459_25397 [Capsicum annuum]